MPRRNACALKQLRRVESHKLLVEGLGPVRLVHKRVGALASLAAKQIIMNPIREPIVRLLRSLKLGASPVCALQHQDW